MLMVSKVPEQIILAELTTVKAEAVQGLCQVFTYSVSLHRLMCFFTWVLFSSFYNVCSRRTSWSAASLNR